MRDNIILEELFILEDINKNSKLLAVTDEQLRQVKKIEEEIENKKKELCIPCQY